MAGATMSNEIRYYKGKHEVRVVTKSVGYWIVEAMEEFEDEVEGEKVMVGVGERRIVPSNTVRKRKSMPPLIKEHAYELKMEKKLKRLVAKEEKKQSGKETQ
jgi:Leu/Phe-tRNA-protein transferase